MVLSAGLTGCSKEQEEVPVKRQPEVATYRLMRDAVVPTLIEGNDGLLPLLKGASGVTLILCSPSPLLEPVPGEGLQRLQAASSAGDIVASRTGRTADPLILPEMTLSAVIELGLVSRVVWVLPAASEGMTIDHEALTTYLGSLSRKIDPLVEVVAGLRYRTTIDGIPFEIALGMIPPVETPAWLHLDLAQILAEYRGEVKHPMLMQVGGMLAGWRSNNLSVAGVTISYSTHTGDVPLSMRVLGSMVGELIAEPSRLDEEIDPLYEKWGRLLYLEAFFSYEEIGNLLTGMLEISTDRAWVWYANYSFAKKMGGFPAAEKFLAEAVKRDVGYAMEYINVAVDDGERFRKETVIELTRQAVAATKGDPLFVVTLCEELRNAERWNELESCIGRARQYPWSSIYYGGVLPVMDRWEKEVHAWQTGTMK